MLGAANRDATRFPDADTLDVTRENNRHLAFGLGVHYCLGAPLARVEGEMALHTLLRRMPDLRLNAQPRELAWRPSPGLRGPTSLPVAWN